MTRRRKGKGSGRHHAAPAAITLLMDIHDWRAIISESSRWDAEMAGYDLWAPDHRHPGPPPGVSMDVWLSHWRPSARWTWAHTVPYGPAAVLARAYLTHHGHAFEMIHDESLCRCNRDDEHCRCQPEVLFLTNWTDHDWTKDPRQSQCACGTWHPAATPCPCKTLLTEGTP